MTSSGFLRDPDKGLKTMDMDETKQKEQQLKETAQKKNLVIMKSKNGYMLVDYYTSRIVAGRDYSLSLDDTERFLEGY
jgi:hypothetical protein